jgi:hypothetical protein
MAALVLDPNIAAVNPTGELPVKAARTTTGNSGWVKVGDAREIIAQLHSDAGTGTTPTLDVKLQTSIDGTDGNQIDVPTSPFTQVTTSASNQIKSVLQFHHWVKVVWTIAGTTPSFNFGVYLTARR